MHPFEFSMITLREGRKKKTGERQVLTFEKHKNRTRRANIMRKLTAGERMTLDVEVATAGPTHTVKNTTKWNC